MLDVGQPQLVRGIGREPVTNPALVVNDRAQAAVRRRAGPLALATLELAERRPSSTSA